LEDDLEKQNNRVRSHKQNEELTIEDCK